MRQFGDVTKLNGADLPIVNIITGGSPCQGLSVAGKRKGLEDERSGLFMEQIRIIKEMREHDRNNGTAESELRPRYMVWENVAGALTCSKGQDFQAVLEETVKIADENAVISRLEEGQKWSNAGLILAENFSVAWRLHDAQWWGVPQRRKRLCMVADFNGQSAGEILFNPRFGGETEYSETFETESDIGDESRPEVQSVDKSVSGNIEQGNEKREETSGDIRDGISQTSRTIGKCLNSWDVQSKHIQPEDGIAETLYSGECRGGGGESYVLQENKTVCYGIGSYDSNAMKSSNPHSGIYEAETARTLDLNGGSPACNQGGMAVVYDASRRHNYGSMGDICETVQAHYGTGGNNVPIVLEGNGSRDSHKGNGYKVSEIMYTLNTVEQHAVFDARGNGKGDLSPTITGDHQNRITDYTAVCVNYPEKTGSLCASGYNKLGTQEAANDMYVVQSSWDGGQVSPTLTANNANGAQRMPDKDNFNAVITYGLDRAAFNQGKNALYDFSVDEEMTGPQVARGPGAVFQSVVRRLTPKECSRLQGYPDGWCDIGEWKDTNGKIHKDSDSVKYKSLGNSVALPFWQWMAERMIAVLKKDGIENPTMGSLFSGIGGFELVYKRTGCEPLWASEIEPFPIAVVRKHFGDEDTDETGDIEKFL